MIRCVLITRDKAVQKVLSPYLEKYGISVGLGESWADSQPLLSEPGAVDIVVLDLALADGDGPDLCHWIHATLHKPLIVVTERSDIVNRVRALESGADDYIDKPYDPRELVARIRAVLRRMATVQTDGPAMSGVKSGMWTLDGISRELQGHGGITVLLSSTEFRLLKAFVDQPAEVLSREYLVTQMSEGMPSPTCHPRLVDLAVSRLRQKLVDVPTLTWVIRTVRGKGYQLIQPDLTP